MDDLHAAGQAVQAHLPIGAYATAVTLITQESAADRWSKAATFALA